MNLRDRMSLRFMRHLVATPTGRAHILGQVADAEGSDEAAIFDRALSRVEDPELRKLIGKHKADEERHERLFRARVAATGVALPPVPEELKLIHRLDAATGHFLERPIEDGRGVMEAYALLQVIEERAIRQFTLMERAFRPVDAESADTFAAMARDEERHLKYCEAIGRRYATDETSRQSTLRRFRRVEERAFRANGAANLRYVLERGYLRAGVVAQLCWRALSYLQLRALATAPSPLPAAA